MGPGEEVADDAAADEEFGETRGRKREERTEVEDRTGGGRGALAAGGFDQLGGHLLGAALELLAHFAD